MAGIRHVGAGLAALRRHDADDGSLVWDQQVGSVWDDGAYGVSLDAEGFPVFAGYQSPNGSTRVPWIAKYGIGGLEQWSYAQDSGLSPIQWARGVAIDPETDRSTIVGWYADANPGLFHAHHGSDGDLLEMDTVDSSGSFGLDPAIAYAEHGVFVLAGELEQDGAPSSAWVRQYDESGEMWTHTFDEDSTQGEKAMAVTVDPEGYVVVAGASFEAEQSVALIRKLDFDGSVRWTVTLDGLDWGQANGIAAGSDGRLYVVGTGRMNDQEDTDTWLARLAP